MSESDGYNSDHGDAAPAVGEADRLITRIVDGEASDAERAAFESMAEREPALWRALAEHQQSAGLLQRGFDRHADAAARVELPSTTTASARPSPDAGHRVGRRGPWIAAGLGWAAAVGLAMVWLMTGGGDDEPGGGLMPIDLPPIEQLGHDDALQRYLDAPWVRGQMQPILLDIEPQPDGTRRVWIMRRIEEYVDVPADAEVPVNQRNELIEDPAALRSSDERDGDGDKPKG